MFIHLGGDIAISDDELVAIIGIEPMRKGSGIGEYITAMRSRGKLQDLSGGTAAAKTLVVTRDRAFLSPISPGTLRRRVREIPV